MIWLVTNVIMIIINKLLYNNAIQHNIKLNCSTFEIAKTQTCKNTMWQNSSASKLYVRCASWFNPQ